MVNPRIQVVMHHDRAVESEESGFAPDPLWAVWQISAPQTMQMKYWQPYGFH